MALVVADRVQETTTTTGTGTVTLAGASAGYQSFATIGNGNTTYYTLTSGNNWEVGIGTYTSSGTTLARTTVLASSAGGTTKITLSGTSNVFVTYPAEIATMLGNPTATNGGVVYGTGTAIGVSAVGTVSGYQFLQSAGAASPTWVQIPSFKDVAVAPSSPAPIEGDRFFDNTSGINYTYITDANGSQWVETSATGAASNVYTKTTFTATASQTTFTLNYNVGYVDVYLNGVKLTTSDYTASTGTTVVLGVAAALNDIVETIAWTVWSATNTAIGAGTGTSLALNGATLGSNALAVTGTAAISGAVTGLTFNSSTLAVPTRQVLTSGTTYTTPANVRQLRIRMVGGGSGGTASISGTVGSVGAATSFNGITAAGGKVGSLSYAGNNNSGQVGTGTASLRVQGGSGGTAQIATSGAWPGQGGSGGNSAFGGGGIAGSNFNANANGVAAQANSGGGGGGGSSDATAGNYGGGGGCAGEYVEIIINSPAATYTYTVGAGGAGGTTGLFGAGGNGGSGVIIVDEFY